MTLHAAKGLEFPVVFIVALEQGLLPHERSTQDAKELEEERRLLFVGITRAQEDLQLSLARNREFRGVRRMTVPSTFLMELPRQEMRVAEPTWASAPTVDDWQDHGVDAEFDEEFEELSDFFSTASDEVEPTTPDAEEPSPSRNVVTLMTAAELQPIAEGENRPLRHWAAAA
jgi:DNA helicase-2/ATP-dependent DNA helicase PcrA